MCVLLLFSLALHEAPNATIDRPTDRLFHLTAAGLESIDPPSEPFFFGRVGGNTLVVQIGPNPSFQEEHKMILLFVLEQCVFQINVRTFEEHVNDTRITNVRLIVKVFADRLFDFVLSHMDNVVDHHDARDFPARIGLGCE